MKDYFLRLYDHAAWANRRLLDSLRGPEPADGRALKLFSHLLAAERVWAARLQGQDSSGLPIWPDMSIDECAGLMAANVAAYRQYLAGLGEGGMGLEVGYKDSRGQEFRTAVGDILSQVALHGAYHRGQRTAAIKGAGGRAVNTDFITFVREGG